MPPDKRGLNWSEAIPGAIGVLMAVVFLGFMAVDIGSIPLFVITIVVLGMLGLDFVKTVRQRNGG